MSVICRFRPTSNRAPRPRVLLCRCRETDRGPFRVHRLKATLGQFQREWPRMRVVLFLRDRPYVTKRICPGRKFELWFGDQINHFVCRQKIPRIEIDTSVALPDCDLPNREAFNDIMLILQKPVLDPPFDYKKSRHPPAGAASWLSGSFLPLNVVSVSHGALVGVSPPIKRCLPTFRLAHPSCRCPCCS